MGLPETTTAPTVLDNLSYDLNTTNNTVAILLDRLNAITYKLQPVEEGKGCVKSDDEEGSLAYLRKVAYNAHSNQIRLEELVSRLESLL